MNYLLSIDKSQKKKSISSLSSQLYAYTQIITNKAKSV